MRRMRVLGKAVKGVWHENVLPDLRTILQKEIDYGRPQLWLGALFVCGAAICFGIPFDVPVSFSLAAALTALALAFVTHAHFRAFAFASCFAALTLGFLAAGYETWRVAAPKLAVPTQTVIVSGEVRDIEAGGARRPRVLIKLSQIENFSANMPAYVRVTGVNLKYLRVGDAIKAEARLKPFPGPTHPGGYDPGFKAYFNQIGATGTIAKPVELLTQPDRGFLEQAKLFVAQWREGATRRIIDALGGDTGAIAASLVTGDRAALSDELYAAFNGSGLMHVLSISGLHMVLVAGGMFFTARFLFAAFNAFGGNIPAKKAAAIAAIAVVTFYEIISGGAVATTRSYIMILIVFGAVLLSRPALTMRNVVIAALLIAAVSPHEIIGASFQMSFAATAALIAAHERKLFPGFAAWDGSIFAKALAWLATAFVITLLTSVIAEIATVPFTLHHFHRISLFGIAGNVLALIFIELAIMPGVLLTLLLLPLGLEWLSLPLLGFGIDRMVDVAKFVSSLPGALTGMSGFGTPTLLLCSFAICWACFWRGRFAALAAIPYILGLGYGAMEKAPDIYISPFGASIAARGEQGALGVAMSPRDTFTVRRWLENDGDKRDVDDPSLRGMFACDGMGCTVVMKNGLRLAVSRQRASLSEDCVEADILIMTKANAPAHCTRPELIIDKRQIRDAQGLSVYIEHKKNGGFTSTMRSVADECGKRPWCATEPATPKPPPAQKAQQTKAGQ